MKCVAEGPDIAADADFHIPANIPDGGWTRRRNSAGGRDIWATSSSFLLEKSRHRISDLPTPPKKDTPLIEQSQSPCFNKHLSNHAGGGRCSFVL